MRGDPEAVRERLAGLADEMRARLEAEIGTGYRVVVVVTPEDGSFVGVSSSTHLADTEAILRCAATPADHRDHPRR